MQSEPVYRGRPFWGSLRLAPSLCPKSKTLTQPCCPRPGFRHPAGAGLCGVSRRSCFARAKLLVSIKLLLPGRVVVGVQLANLSGLVGNIPSSVMDMLKGQQRYNALPQSSDDSIDHQYRREELGGGYGHQHGAHNNPSSLLEKGKRQYWTSKQYVRELLGREEDEHVAREDADLDRQVQRARHIQKQCTALNKTLLHYQRLVQTLSSREMTLSALLRAQALREGDGPCAEMMSRLGTVMQEDATRRFELDVPLTRLFQEVETYRCRALIDTLIDINHMAEERRRYRGSLLRMADASRQLDPEAARDLEKFRKAQAMVRDSKRGFDRKKDKVCEKTDLLAASFCNLLSNNMVPYQTALGSLWKQSAASYRELLEWARNTLRHQYRLTRDIERERDRRAAGPDVSASSEAPATSELWSEGRLLEVVGEAPIVEQAQDALEAGSEPRPNDIRRLLEEAQAGATENGKKDGEESVVAEPNHSSSEGTQKADSKPAEYSWLDLMTEGSAASAMEEFGGASRFPNESASGLHVQETLFKLAQDAVAGSGTQLTSEDQSEAVSSYEMAAPEQMLDGAMRQLTSDESRLEELVPMNTGLRQRQQDDMQAEARLEKELSQMVESFGSLPTHGGDEPGDEAVSDDLWHSMVKASAQSLPADLLDMSTDDSAGALPSTDMQSMPTSLGVGTASAGSTLPQGSGQRPRPSKKPEQPMSKWYNLFAELDPLANPDDLPFGDQKKTEKLAL